MSRNLATGADDALQAAHVSQVMFIEFDFLSGSSHACSREHNVDWNGNTWIGAGAVGSIEPVGEGAVLEARGIALMLSMLPVGLLSIALTPSEYKGRDVSLWFGQLDFSDPAAMAVVADPVGPFIFKMDQLAWQMGADTAALRLTAESRLTDWNRPRVRRYNDADHQSVHPGDLFFQYTEKQVEQVYRW